MDPRDDDIEFDFFEEEPATTEAQSSPSRVRLPRRGGRGTGSRRPAGPQRGLTPLLRLLALIAIIVAVLVFFGLVIQSCASTSKHDAYKSYMAKVGSIAQSSDSDGAGVASAMTSGGKVADLEKTLLGIADQERQTLAAAQKLSPPGPLRPEHEDLTESLQLRINGVQGLADTFRATATSKATSDAALLAAQADRLLASDVTWDDLFLEPAKREMKAQGVSGVVVPESHFVTNHDLITERSMGFVLQRLRGASTSGGTPTGIHGTNIINTKALPGGQTLSPDSDNTVTATTDLAFVVAVADSGDSQEVNIKVTLTIQKPQGAIVKTQTIDLINPGQTKTVTFQNLGQVPFAQKTTVLVDVAPVPGEHNTSNNKSTYPVIFSLG